MSVCGVLVLCNGLRVLATSYVQVVGISSKGILKRFSQIFCKHFSNESVECTDDNLLLSALKNVCLNSLHGILL